MSKILKPGKIPTATAVWPIGETFTCPRCACEWQIEQSGDFFTVTHPNGLGAQVRSHCPTCNTPVDKPRKVTPDGKQD